MIPSKVYFTGMDFEPSEVQNRWHRGVIPLEWRRYRFITKRDFDFPINRLNKWLMKNIEGRWAVWLKTSKQDWEISIAFEKDFDGFTFVMADGKNEAFK